jgi:translation elongation factor EF-Ts
VVCEAALVEAGWDGDAAFAALRKKGLAAAQKKVRSEMREKKVMKK